MMPTRIVLFLVMLSLVAFCYNLTVKILNLMLVNFQVNELVKDLVRYSEELHKKHKQIKVHHIF